MIWGDHITIWLEIVMRIPWKSWFHRIGRVHSRAVADPTQQALCACFMAPLSHSWFERQLRCDPKPQININMAMKKAMKKAAKAAPAPKAMKAKK